MVSLNIWRSSAFAMVVGFAPSSFTPIFSRKPFSHSSMARFRPVWPPRLGSRESGRSFLMIS